jgi:phosphate transport system permease protein
LIEVLAGIPSIVPGLFGWVTLAPAIQALGAPSGLTAFTGALILAFMSLPTIISITEDALYAVPKEYRDGSLALGATQWQTIWRVVVPAATGNAANIPALGPEAFFQPVRTMTATIAAEMGEVARGSLHYNVLFIIGIALFVITFLINSLASWVIGGSTRRRGSQL